VKVVASAGREDVAVVYVGETDDGRPVEFCEALQPPASRDEKWVLMVSTMSGCPVECAMCDAGSFYRGKLSAAEILAQVDYLVARYYPDGAVPAAKFKVQFARAGEPALNDKVLDALVELPRRYRAPGLIPSLSTVAPAAREDFFTDLLKVKDRLYSGGRFQLQFSIHSTDAADRDRLIPVRKWDLEAVAAYGARFHKPGDRKITLNFALASGAAVDTAVLRRYFEPASFLVKLTPVNPTYAARARGLNSYVGRQAPAGGYGAVRALRAAGYEVVVSVGELEENSIGSNCGQFLRAHLFSNERLAGGYAYTLQAPPPLS